MAQAKVRRELKRNDYAKRGLVAVMAVVLVLGLMWLRSSGTYGGPEHVSAQLADAGGSLGSGADVKIRGVIVGKVSGISRGPQGGVRVRIAISKDRLDEVPSNVVARILPATVFGTTFVDLVPRGRQSTTSLRSDAVIPADPSQATLELQQALDDIDRLVTALGPAELASAIGSAAQALDGRGDQLGNIVDRLDSYLGKLNPRIPDLQEDVRKLSGALQVADEVAPDLLRATDDALVAARTVVTQKAQIARLISGGTSLALESNEFLDANEERLIRFLENGVTILDAIYDNRNAGITQAFATNRLLNVKLGSLMNGGFLNTVAKVVLEQPPAYSSADCPRYDAARGDNCSALGRAGVGAMFDGGAR